MKKILCIALLLLSICGTCFAGNRWEYVTDFYIDGNYAGKIFVDTYTIENKKGNVLAWFKDVITDKELEREKAKGKAAAEKMGIKNIDLSELKQVSYSHVEFDTEHWKYRMLNIDEYVKSLPNYKEWNNIEPDSLMERKMDVALIYLRINDK